MRLNKIFKLKTIILGILILGLGACEGRRDFPDLVETGVVLDNEDILLVSGETIDVSARFIPNVYPQRDYIWEVDDPEVADLEMNEDKSVSLTATGSGETMLRIISQDADNLVAEARLKVIPSAPVDITDEAEITVNREYSGGAQGAEGSLKVVDGDLNSKYLSGWVTPFWLNLEFEEAEVVNIYRLTSGNDAPGRDPRDWQLLGSNDGENWDVLDVRTGESFNSRNQTREFYFENDQAYTHYRLDVINNNGAGLFQMSEWRVFELPE